MRSKRCQHLTSVSAHSTNQCHSTLVQFLHGRRTEYSSNNNYRNCMPTTISIRIWPVLTPYIVGSDIFHAKGTAVRRSWLMDQEHSIWDCERQNHQSTFEMQQVCLSPADLVFVFMYMIESQNSAYQLESAQRHSFAEYQAAMLCWPLNSSTHSPAALFTPRRINIQ